MNQQATFALAFAVLATSATAQDWPNWRGPNWDGSTNVSGLPTEFDKETNVAWKAEMPGPSAATPIIVGNRIYLSSIGPEATLLALCLSRETGEVLWQHDAGSGYRPAGDVVDDTQLDSRSTYSAPSPSSDGERVVFFYGNGDLVTYDPDGELLWRRNLQADYGDFAFQWTFSTSPTLVDGMVYLAILQRDQPANGRGKADAESFLLGLDAATGETKFKALRPAPAVMESLESYATIVPRQRKGGETELLVIGGDVITGHSPTDGAELWRWGTWNEGHREQWWRVVPSPVVGGGVVLACAPKTAPVYAVHLDDGDGDLGPSSLAWKSEGRRNPVSSDVPTPLYYQDDFFVLSDVQSALSRVDAKSGEVEWSIDMPREHRWRASPTGADGRVWCMDHSGRIVVVDAESGEVTHETTLGEEDEDHVRASIAVAQGAVFVRTNGALYCFAK